MRTAASDTELLQLSGKHNGHLRLRTRGIHERLPRFLRGSMAFVSDVPTASFLLAPSMARDRWSRGSADEETAPCVKLYPAGGSRSAAAHSRPRWRHREGMIWKKKKKKTQLCWCVTEQQFRSSFKTKLIFILRANYSKLYITNVFFAHLI